MKKTFLISIIGLTIILSACSQQSATNNEEENSKISQLEQQIIDLQTQSQKNIDSAKQISELKKENEELKKQLDQKIIIDTKDDKSQGSIQIEDNETEITKKSNSTINLPTLSEDKKNIVSKEGGIILPINNDIIFDWFKTKSQLCDGYNLTSTSDRKMFCENKVVFKEKTKFKSIVVSPDKEEIGFTIESDTLTPDTVVGIFSQSQKTVKLLTSYYLGNEFISFSPSGASFIYKGNCWEAMCGLFIKDSKTFNDKKTINNPEFVDYRMSDVEFIKWISDNEIEYNLNSINSDDVKIERLTF